MDYILYLKRKNLNVTKLIFQIAIWQLDPAPTPASTRAGPSGARRGTSDHILMFLAELTAKVDALRLAQVPEMLALPAPEEASSPSLNHSTNATTILQYAAIAGLLTRQLIASVEA